MEKYGWWLPIDISTHGWQIDRLLWVLHAFMAVLFFGWLAFFLFTLYKFRAGAGHKADAHERHFKLPTMLEIAVAVFEVILLVGFSFPIWAHVRNDMPQGKGELRVRVVAEQFAWNVHYPGKDGVFGRTDPKLMNASNPLGIDRTDPKSHDDVTTINQLHVPVDTPVICDLTSKDVIHSFFLPVMRVKQDTVPGQNIAVWFQATATGDFEIACAQLCGLGHYRMRGFFVVDEKDKFERWLNEQAPKPEDVTQFVAEAAAAAAAPVAPPPSAAPAAH